MEHNLGNLHLKMTFSDKAEEMDRKRLKYQFITVGNKDNPGRDGRKNARWLWAIGIYRFIDCSWLKIYGWVLL